MELLREREPLLEAFRGQHDLVAGRVQREAVDARQRLCAPVLNRRGRGGELFFCGEATHPNIRCGTADLAIETGARAAAEVMRHAYDEDGLAALGAKAPEDVKTAWFRGSPASEGPRSRL